MKHLFEFLVINFATLILVSLHNLLNRLLVTLRFLKVENINKIFLRNTFTFILAEMIKSSFNIFFFEENFFIDGSFSKFCIFNISVPSDIELFENSLSFCMSKVLVYLLIKASFYLFKAQLPISGRVKAFKNCCQ
jgi:hypothetical protein